MFKLFMFIFPDFLIRAFIKIPSFRTKSMENKLEKLLNNRKSHSSPYLFIIPVTCIIKLASPDIFILIYLSPNPKEWLPSNNQARQTLLKLLPSSE